MRRGLYILVLLCLGVLGSGVQANRGDNRLIVFAGGGEQEEGIATECRLNQPFGVAKDSKGNYFIVEMSGRVLKVDRHGNLTRLAGRMEQGYAGDGGWARNALLKGPHSIVALPNNDLIIADTLNHRVRKISAKTGIITTIAGTGVAGFSGDGGVAEQAMFNEPYCLALNNSATQLYIIDLKNRRIRKMDMATNVVTTVAGNGFSGVPADGSLASQSPLVDPRAVAVDSKGRLYLLERGGHALRVIDTGGRIRTLVGSGKAGGVTDTDGLKATLRSPKHLWVDQKDNVLIADSDNHCIRHYDPKTGKIVRVVGTSVAGSVIQPNDPDLSQLNQPHGIYEDASGFLYISDSTNHRVLRWRP